MSERYVGGVAVVAYSPDWPHQFQSVAGVLRTALGALEISAIEHVGSTAVPGLSAKPVLDIDVIVSRNVVAAATEALEAVGYVNCGDLGVADRQAFTAPDEQPPRNVYVCVANTLHVRNHLAVRAVLRADPELRDRYGAVKGHLASEPNMDIGRYTAGKSAVLQEILAGSDLTAEEKREIYELNMLC